MLHIRPFTVLLLATPLLGGCQTHLQLCDNAVKMTNTLTEYNYQQVLDNVAMFVQNPSALPSVALLNAGTANVSDQKAYSGNANYAPTLTFHQQGGGALPILTLLFNPSVQRVTTENWSLVPIIDTDHLRRIRCAFQLLVIDGETTECDQCRARLATYFLGDGQDWEECIIPHGWYQVGHKKDVPKDACYTGCYESCYVWVTPDGLEGLTRFTMTVLDLMTGKARLPTKTVVKTYKADGALETRQETTTEIDQEALAKLRKEADPGDRPRKSQFSVNPGLFFVPR